VLYSRAPIIEIASYLQDEQDGEVHVRETLAHEMIHYWLWVRHRPHGHTDEFYAKMTEMGARRYNPVPKRRPHKYLYLCGFCRMEFKSRRLLGRLACAKCCKDHGNGKYEERFRLVLVQKLAPALLMLLLSVQTLAVQAQAFSGLRGSGEVLMTKLDGSKQCEPAPMAALEAAVRSELKEHGVEVLELRHVDHQKSHPKSQVMRIALCGAPTGGAFEIKITSGQKEAAEALGFKEAPLP